MMAEQKVVAGESDPDYLELPDVEDTHVSPEALTQLDLSMGKGSKKHLLTSPMWSLNKIKELASR